MVAQFILGFMHHRIYKKTMAPTKLAPLHIWLGRLVVPAGVANGFLSVQCGKSPLESND